MTHEQSSKTKTQEILLDPEEIEMIQEFDASLQAIHQQRRGALMMAVRRRKLQGSWDYRDGKLISTTPENKEQ